MGCWEEPLEASRGWLPCWPPSAQHTVGHLAPAHCSAFLAYGLLGSGVQVSILCWGEAKKKKKIEALSEFSPSPGKFLQCTRANSSSWVSWWMVGGGQERKSVSRPGSPVPADRPSPTLRSNDSPWVSTGMSANGGSPCHCLVPQSGFATGSSGVRGLGRQGGPERQHKTDEGETGRPERC